MHYLENAISNVRRLQILCKEIGVVLIRIEPVILRILFLWFVLRHL